MSGCSIFNESVTSIANQIRVADIPNDINGALLLNSANKILDVLKEKTDYLLAAYVAWGNSIKDFYIEEELQKLDFELTELQNSGALDETKKENIEQRRKLLLEAKNSDKSFVELYYDVKNTTPVELTEEQIKEYYNTEEGTKELYNKYLEAYEDEAMAKSAYILFCEENGIMLTGDMKKIVDERNTLYNKLVSQGVYNETQIAQKMMSFDAKNNLSIEVLNQYKAELEQNKQEYIGSASNKKEEERLLHEWEVLNGMVQDDALLDKLKTSGKLSYSEQLDAQRAALEEAAKEGQSLEEIARNGFITLTTGGILNVGVLALTFTQGLFGFGEGVYDAALTLGASDFIQNTEKWLKGEEVSPFKHTQDVNKMFKDYWSEYYQSEEYKKEFQEWYQKNNESYDPMGEFKLYVENKFKKEYGSSSTIYSKAVEEAIETGDYSNLDNIDLNTLRNAAKQFDTMDKVAISYVNDFAQHYIYDKDWYKEIEQYSLIKHDGILGQVSLQIGRMAIPIALSLIPGGVSLGALGTLSIGATASSAALGISAFGSAAEGAYTDGATYEQGVKYATLSAATEMLTEKLFSGVAGIGEGWLDNALASRLDKIMYKISPKLSDNLIAQISKNLFVKGVGEGVEEVTSDLLDPIWQWMTYKSDYELKDVYKENVSLKSLAQTFLISALTGIFMGGAEIGRNVNRFNTQLDSLNNLNKLFPNVEEYANAALAHMINMEGSTYSKVEVIDEIINTISSKMAEDARNAHPVPDLIDSLSNIKDGSSQIRIGGETITLSNEALYNILDSAKINNNKLEINLDGEVIETDVLGDGSSGIIDISDSASRVLSPETITEISFSDAKVQSRFMNSLFNSAESSLQQMLANPDIDSLSKEKINSLIEQIHNMKNNGNFSENIHDVANVINNMYNTRMNSVFTTLSDDMVVSNPVRVTDELYKYTAVYKDADGNYKTVTVYSNSNINYDSIFTDPATIESEITRAINANKDGDYVYIGKPTIESTGEVVFNEEIGAREKIEQIESSKGTQIKEDAEIIDVSENSDVVEETGVNTRENVNVTEETNVNTRENVNATEETGVNTRENVNPTEETGVNTRENVNVTEETGVNTRENVNATEEAGVNTRENVNATEETNTNTTSETLSAASVGAASMSGVMSGVRTTTTGSTTTGTTVNTNENVSTDTVGRRINTNEHGTARGSVTETSTVTEGSTGTVSGISSYLKQILSEKITIIKSNVHKGYVIRGLSKSFIENRIYDINTISKGLNKIGSKINADTNILTKAGHNMFITTSEFINQFAGRIEVIKDNVFNGKVVSGIAKMITFPYQTTIDGVRHTINFFGRTLGSDMNFDINNNITEAKNTVIESIKSKVDSTISDVTAEADVSRETVDSSLGESIVESGAAVVEEVMSEKITPPTPTLDSSKNVDVNSQENVVKSGMEDYFAPDLSDDTVKQTEQKVSQEYKMDDLYDTPTLEPQKKVDVSDNVANNQIEDVNIGDDSAKIVPPSPTLEINSKNMTLEEAKNLIPDLELTESEYENVMSELTERGLSFDDYVDRPDIVGVDITGVNTSEELLYEIEKQYNKLIPSFKEEIRKWIEIRNTDYGAAHSSAINYGGVKSPFSHDIIEKLIELGNDFAGSDTASNIGKATNARLKYDYRITINNNPTISLDEGVAFSSKLNELLSQNDISISAKIMWDADAIVLYPTKDQLLPVVKVLETMKNEQIVGKDVAAATRHFARDLKTLAAPIGKNPYYGISCSDGPARFDKRGTSVKSHRGSIAAKEFGMSNTFGNYVNDQILNPTYSELYQKYNGDTSLITPDEMYDLAIKRHNLYSTGSAEVTLPIWERPYNKMHYHKDNVTDLNSKASEGGNVDEITPPTPTLDSSKNVDVNSQENVVKSGMEDYFAPDLSDNTVKQTEQKVSQEYKMDDLYDTPTLEPQKEVNASDNVANNQVVDSNNNITSNAKKGFAPQTSAELETPNVGVDSKSKLLEEIRLRHADELQLELQKAKERQANPVISSSSILTSENTISFENCVEENISDRTLQKVAQDLALNKGITNELKDLFFTNNEYDSATLVAPQFNNKAELHILRAMESGQGYTKFDTGVSISKDSPKLPPGMPNKRMRAYINPSNPEIHYKTLDMIMERCIDQGLDIGMKPTGSWGTGNVEVDKAVVYFNDPKVIKIIDEVTNEIISKNPNAYGTPCLCGLTSKNGSFSFGRADVYTISTLREYVSRIEKQAYYNTIAASSSDIQMQVIEKIQQSHFISKTNATSIVNEILNFDAFKNNMRLFVRNHSVVINGVRTGEFNEIVQEIINKQNIDGSKINIDDFRKNILTLNSVLEFGDKSHLINPAISKGMYEAGFIDKYSIGNSIDGEITPPPPTLDSSKNVDVNLQENVVKSGMEDYFAPDLSDNTVKQTEQKVSQDYNMDDLYDTPTLESQKEVNASDNVSNNQVEDINIGYDSAKIVPPAPNLNKTGESTIMEMVQENLDAKVLTNGNEWSVIEELGEHISKNSNLYRKIENEYLEFDSLVKDANRRFTDIIESLDSDSVVRENITNQAENTLNDVREKIDKIYNWNFDDYFDYETREMLETAKTDMLNRYGTLEDLIQKISAKTEMGVNIESPAIKSDSDLAKVLLNSDPVVSKFGDWSKNINKSGEDINLDTDSAKIIPPEPTTTLETKVEADTAWTETDRTNFLREYYSSEIELASDTNALKDMLTKETGAESLYVKTSDDVIRGMIDAQASGLDLNVTKEIQALLDATKRLKPGEVILNRKGVLDGETPVVLSEKVATEYSDIIKQTQTGMDSGMFTKEDAQQIFKLLNEQGIKSTESIENLKTKIVERYLNDEIQLTPEAVQRLTNITKRLKPGEVILNMSSVLDGEAPVVIPNEMTAKYGDIVRQTQNALDSGVFNEESAQQIFELLNEQGVKSTESIERLKFKVKHNLNTALLEINSDVFSDSQAEISIQESHLKRMETIVDSIENKLKPRLEDELAKLEEDYESQRKLLELEKSEKLEELKVTTKNTLSEYDMELDIDMKYKYGDKFRTLEQDYKDAIDRLNREYESGIQKIFTKEMSEVRIGETKAIIESVSPTVKEVDAIIGFTEKEIMDIKPGEDVGYSGRSKVELLDTLEKLKTKRIEAERVARDLAEKESKIDPVDFSEGGKYDGSQRYILGRNRAPLSTETIERMVKDIGVHPYESLSDNESFLAKKFGISVDQLRFELDKKIRDFVGEGYVGIRKGVKSLSDILDSGYIKNQFETKTSSATKGGPTEDIEKKHRDRSRVEHNTFGLEYDTPYADRPIYGMMFPANLAKLKTYIKTGPGWWYGSGEEKCVIILNKDAVRKTTSITMGDSFGATYASTLDNPTYSGGITMSINERFKSLEEFRNADLTKIFNDADRNYLECQIYGQASHAMTPEVVKEVIFTELPSESLIEKLEKANIPWRVL